MNIPLNIDWQQILLHLFNFSILGGGLYFLLYQPVKSFMEKREQYYKDRDAQSEEKMKQAQAMCDDYKTKLQEADEAIRQKKDEAQKSIAASNAEQLADARKQAEKILADAKAASEREREKIMANTQKDLADLAMKAAEKILMGDGDIYDQFLDTAQKGAENGES